MKVILLYFFLFFSVFFTSCNSDIITHNEEDVNKTELLRALYLEKVYGSWSCIEKTDFMYAEEYYTFKPDKSLEGHVILKSREQVSVGGEQKLTDWNTIFDTDITGKWDLFYHSSSTKNVLYVSSDEKYGPNRYAEFIKVNDDIMEIESPILGTIVQMQRDK